MKKILIIFIHLIIATNIYCQDEFILRKTKEPAQFELKIDTIYQDTLFYTSFRKQKKIPLTDIIAYRQNYKKHTDYIVPNPIDSTFLTENLKENTKKILPNSFINLGIGYGLNYGMLGTKTVLGYKNSGLLIGLGFATPSLLAYEIGIQLSYGFVFINAGYGVVLIESIEGYNTIMINRLNGINCKIGSMISIGKQKRLFVDLGIGYSYRTDPSFLDYFKSNSVLVDKLSFTFDIGIGYRFGGKKIAN